MSNGNSKPVKLCDADAADGPLRGPVLIARDFIQTTMRTEGLDERMIRVARVMNDLSACKNLGLVRKSLEPDPLSTPDALSQGLAAGTASPTRKPDPKRRVTSAPAKA